MNSFGAPPFTHFKGVDIEFDTLRCAPATTAGQLCAKLFKIRFACSRYTVRREPPTSKLGYAICSPPKALNKPRLRGRQNVFALPPIAAITFDATVDDGFSIK